MPNSVEQFLDTWEVPDEFLFYFHEYLGAVREIRRLRLVAHENDPFIGYRMGVYGLVTVKRLSEWHDNWDDFAAPLIQALGGNAADTPWQSVYRPIGGYAQTPTRPAARRIENEVDYLH